MQAPQQTSHAQPIRTAADLKLAAHPLLEYRKVNAVGLVQGCSRRQSHGRHHGDFVRGAVERKGVLLLDRLARPAARPVELGDQTLTIHGLRLVDPVDVARQRRGQSTHARAERVLHCIEHDVGYEVFEVRCLFHAKCSMAYFSSARTLRFWVHFSSHAPQSVQASGVTSLVAPI